MEIKTVGIASDHAAFPLKQFVKQYLEEKGIEYIQDNIQLIKEADEKYPLPKKLDFRMHD
mgnify:CR=1 FL=1